jgi:hypothetical protein
MAGPTSPTPTGRRCARFAGDRTQLVILATAADQPDLTASDSLYAQALERRGVRVAAAPWDGAPMTFDGVVREGRLIVIEVEVLEPSLFMDCDPPPPSASQMPP